MAGTGPGPFVLGTVADVTAELLSVSCPRCSRAVEVRFYGPCDECREELRATFAIEARVIELAEYEPKMNVTPNAVAFRSDD